MDFTTVMKIIFITAPILILIGVIFIILKKMNKKIDNKLEKEKDKANRFKDELKQIKKIKDSEEKLEKLDSLSKKFFKEELNLKENENYLYLLEKTNENSVKKKYSKLMINLLYRGLEPTQKRIKTATLLFGVILSNKKSS